MQNWNICVFCVCVCVIVRSARGNIISNILEKSSFQKYNTCWIFLALRDVLYLCICLFVYLCICVFLYLCVCVFVYFVFVYLCMRHLVISVLISLDQELSENIWFVWSRTCYKGEKLRCHACDGHTHGHTRGRKLESRAVFCWGRIRNTKII